MSLCGSRSSKVLIYTWLVFQAQYNHLSFGNSRVWVYVCFIWCHLCTQFRNLTSASVTMLNCICKMSLSLIGNEKCTEFLQRLSVLNRPLQPLQPQKSFFEFLTCSWKFFKSREKNIIREENIIRDRKWKFPP